MAMLNNQMVSVFGSYSDNPTTGHHILLHGPSLGSLFFLSLLSQPKRRFQFFQLCRCRFGHENHETRLLLRDKSSRISAGWTPSERHETLLTSSDSCDISRFWCPFRCWGDGFIENPISRNICLTGRYQQNFWLQSEVLIPIWNWIKLITYKHS